jgi:GTP-binding protein Era
LLRELCREAGLPAILAVNKVDLLAPAALVPLLGRERDAGIWAGVFGISARTGRAVPGLIDAVLASLPVGTPVHSDEILSDQPEREFFAEMIREQIFHVLHQELPYSVAVVIDEVAEQPEPHRYRIRATLYVERDSQKGSVGAEGGLRQIIRPPRDRRPDRRAGLLPLGQVRRNWTRRARCASSASCARVSPWS